MSTLRFPGILFVFRLKAVGDFFISDSDLSRSSSLSFSLSYRQPSTQHKVNGQLHCADLSEEDIHGERDRTEVLCESSNTVLSLGLPLSRVGVFKSRTTGHGRHASTSCISSSIRLWCSSSLL